MKLSAIIGGLAGACALTIINQAVSKIDKDAPRLDLLGMNAVAKLARGPANAAFLAQKIAPTSLAADLISNTFYFALAADNSKGKTIMRGLLLGAGAGIGAVVLPQVLGLTTDATDRNPKNRALTIAWYVLGGLVSAMTTNAVERKTSSVVKATPLRKPQPVLAGL